MIKAKFTFFDGVKLFENLYFYDNWLSSIDYSVWKDSYVEIDNERLFIIRDTVKVLSTFRFFNKEELEALAQKYNLLLKEEKGCYYAYDANHTSKQLEMAENDKIIAIYSLDGDRFPERIHIYGVFYKLD